MTFDIGLVLFVLLVALVMFVKEWFPPDGVAMGVFVALVVGGIVTPKDAFACFGNEALITVAAMYVIANGLIRTGAISFVGQRILSFARGSEVKVMLALMVAGASTSAFINNTPIVVIFLPIALSLAEATGTTPSKLLMPLSFATIGGGMCTLIGTSTNLLVSNSLPQYGMEPLAFFQPLPLALIGTAMTMLYLVTVGRRLLPSRTTIASGTRGGKIVDYVTELEIPPGSSLIGRTIAEAITARAPGVQVLQLIRGEEILDPTEWEWALQPGDALIVKGDVNSLLGLQRSEGIALARELATPELRARSKDMTLAELLIRPPSTAIGERVRDLNLYQRHGVAVLAVQRHGIHIREKVADLRLRVGDILLVEAESSALESLRDARNFVLLEGVQEQVTLPHKAWWALAVVLAVIVLATLDIPGLPISILAVAGALALVLGGCLSVRDAYRSVDLPILVLVAGTICLGLAMEKSGAAKWIAGGLVQAASPLGDVALLSAVYLITNVLTALISNNGSALLMLPIALETAAQSGLDPLPFLLAIMFAASIDYSTPIGYQVNTIIYGPGGYRFFDFVKVGGPLNLLWWLLATLLIPVFWPLRPG
ncbi:MAG: SLC13 family permease [Planctomycetota bacterium]|nr:MAG: SLC13 family permease [Planctomycetota bacterium]